MTVERFPVEEGAIIVFARAIGDTNPVYYDPEQMVAPPTFVRSSAHFDPDHPLRPKPGQPWIGSGKAPTGIEPGGPDAVGLHAEQHFEYHRPLRPGDVLSVASRPGASWEKVGRSGTLAFSETIVEYRDQGGELVVTARTIAVVPRKAGS